MIVSKRKWQWHNEYRKKKGLPSVTYAEWLADQQDKSASNALREEREFRYQRLKARLKGEPVWAETRASKLGILPPKQLQDTDTVQRHLLDKMVRQEGGCHLMIGRGSGGWHSIGDGSFRRGNGRQHGY